MGPKSEGQSTPQKPILEKQKPIMEKQKPIMEKQKPLQKPVAKPKLNMEKPSAPELEQDQKKEKEKAASKEKSGLVAPETISLDDDSKEEPEATAVAKKEEKPEEPTKVRTWSRSRWTRLERLSMWRCRFHILV